MARGRGSFTKKKRTNTFFRWRERTFNAQGGKCLDCGCEMVFPRRNNIYQGIDLATVDHIIPLDEGGSNGYENLRLICGECNVKRDRSRLYKKRLKEESESKEFDININKYLLG